MICYLKFIRRNSIETSNWALALLPVLGRVINTPTQSTIENPESAAGSATRNPRIVTAPLNCEGTVETPRHCFLYPDLWKEITLLGFFWIWEIQLTDISEKSHVNHSNKNVFITIYWHLVFSAVFCDFWNFLYTNTAQKVSTAEQRWRGCSFGDIIPTSWLSDLGRTSLPGAIKYMYRWGRSPRIWFPNSLLSWKAFPALWGRKLDHGCLKVLTCSEVTWIIWLAKSVFTEK